LQLQRDLRDLKGVQVVASTLVWNQGHPVDGGGTLSRYFDDRPFKAALWFQAAGDTRGQAWAGLFRDADGNGVMEFAPAEAKLPKGRWTPELDFLAWQPADGTIKAELPAGTKVRISIQWREPHDPDFFQHGPDAYRKPLADLRLVLLRQRDPSGTRLPADDLQVVAQSAGLPERLLYQPNSAVYEQTLDFTVQDAGVYALRVEGRVPVGILPPGVATLPALQKSWDLRPRIFVQTLAGAGRAVLQDYATDEGSIGTPGDAHRAITVGAADFSGKPQPNSAAGPPLSEELLKKPNVLAFDEKAGTAAATSLAAGLSASALSAGVPGSRFLEAMGVRPGQVLRVPDRWGTGQSSRR
jgi:hypothetical protein